MDESSRNTFGIITDEGKGKVLKTGGTRRSYNTKKKKHKKKCKMKFKFRKGNSKYKAGR
tara:strand:+ start:197 stop:373 length:177 start_codon:yes stop_codon:yes gene_type:complete